MIFYPVRQDDESSACSGPQSRDHAATSKSRTMSEAASASPPLPQGTLRFKPAPFAGLWPREAFLPWSLNHQQDRNVTCHKAPLVTGLQRVTIFGRWPRSSWSMFEPRALGLSHNPTTTTRDQDDADFGGDRENNNADEPHSLRPPPPPGRSFVAMVCQHGGLGWGGLVLAFLRPEEVVRALASVCHAVRRHLLANHPLEAGGKWHQALKAGWRNVTRVHVIDWSPPFLRAADADHPLTGLISRLRTLVLADRFEPRWTLTRHRLVFARLQTLEVANALVVSRACRLWDFPALRRLKVAQFPNLRACLHTIAAFALAAPQLTHLDMSSMRAPLLELEDWPDERRTLCALAERLVCLRFSTEERGGGGGEGGTSCEVSRTQKWLWQQSNWPVLETLQCRRSACQWDRLVAPCLTSLSLGTQAPVLCPNLLPFDRFACLRELALACQATAVVDLAGLENVVALTLTFRASSAMRDVWFGDGPTLLSLPRDLVRLKVVRDCGPPTRPDFVRPISLPQLLELEADTDWWPQLDTPALHTLIVSLSSHAPGMRAEAWIKALEARGARHLEVVKVRWECNYWWHGTPNWIMPFLTHLELHIAGNLLERFEACQFYHVKVQALITHCARLQELTLGAAPQPVLAKLREIVAPVCRGARVVVQEPTPW